MSLASATISQFSREEATASSRENQQEWLTLQDLLDRLGGISPERIRLHPNPGTATQEDLLDPQQYRLRTQRLELIDGILVEKAPMGWFESVLATVLAGRILAYLERNPLGVVSCGGDGYIKVLPERIRVLDVAFVSWDHVPNRKLTREPCPEFIVDLAVEVLSASNTPAEMRQKRQEFFDRGTRLFWIVDPAQQTVTVYHSVDEGLLRTIDDTITGEEVLPGFELSIREWFQQAQDGTSPPPEGSPQQPGDTQQG